MQEKIQIDYKTRYKRKSDYEKIKAQVEADMVASDNGTWTPKSRVVSINLSVEERIAKMEDDLRHGRIMSFDYPGGLEQWKEDLRSGRYGNKIGRV